MLKLKYFIIVVLVVSLPSYGKAAPIILSPVDIKLWSPHQVNDEIVWNESDIVYINDDAKYTASGFNWPWNNVLIASSQGNIKAWKMDVPKWNFAFSPRWLPNGSAIILYGEMSASYSTYSIALWDGKSLETQTLVSDLSWKIVQPSPSGRYLAFIRGGQPIPGRGGRTPASLCTFDLQTKTENKWGDAEPLFGGISWSINDTLLFSLAPSETEQKAMRPTDANVKPLNWKPKLYAASPDTGQMRILLDDAQRPKPSPDGKWLLFLSSHDPSPLTENAETEIKPDPTIVQNKGNPLFLVLARLDGSNPNLVRREDHGAPDIVWFPDSSGFALCDTRLVSSNADKFVRSVSVSRYDMEKAVVKRIGAFRYIAFQGTDVTEDDRMWRPIAVTRDNRYLMSELTEFEQAPNNGLMLQRFDLQTGISAVVAHIGSVRGMDWRQD